MDTRITVDDRRAKRHVTLGDIEVKGGLQLLADPDGDWNGAICVKLSEKGAGTDCVWNLGTHARRWIDSRTPVRRVPVEIVVGTAEPEKKDLFRDLRSDELFTDPVEAPATVYRYLGRGGYVDMVTGQTHHKSGPDWGDPVRRVARATLTLHDEGGTQ